MNEGDGEIHVHGRVYTYSRHYRDKPPEKQEADKDEIRFVLSAPSHRRPDGPRRTVYWRYVEAREEYLRVVEDQLPSGERQILTAYPDDEVSEQWAMQ